MTTQTADWFDYDWHKGFFDLADRYWAFHDGAMCLIVFSNGGFWD